MNNPPGNQGAAAAQLEQDVKSYCDRAGVIKADVNVCLCLSVLKADNC